MPGWTPIEISPDLGSAFHRPLDAFELGFLWDGLFNGTADNLQHLELRLLSGSRDARLFSEANIVNAWLSTKKRYPLAGATIRGADNAILSPKANMASNVNNNTGFTSEPHFVVREHDVATLRPREIIFGSVATAEEAQRQAAAILDGPRPLSEDLLVQLYVFRETSDIIHLMALMAHCVTDGIANSTFVRCLLDTLAGDGGAVPAQIRLEDRLAMAVPSMDLEPIHIRSLSPAIRRWRRVVGTIIFRMRMAKRQGGHTLPCRLTESTPYIPARSCIVSTSLKDTQTTAVLSNCHLHGITFGNAYLALAQVAMTRVLYRLYLRGRISEEEWTHRKRQPHISGGPLNLRPYLDKEWFEKGGGGEFMLSIGFFFFQLPFMTLGEAPEGGQRILSEGAPPFSDLLTFDRFLHRTWLLKKQAAALFSHPLFFEIMRAVSTARIERTRLGALRWMRRVASSEEENSQEDSTDVPPAVTDSDTPTIWAHGGSSVGNVDLIFPTIYPLPPTYPLSPSCTIPHPMKAGYVTPLSPSVVTAPKIIVENSKTRLHTRPAELYLGASSSRGQLNMYIFYDGNVFEDEVVKEWLGEVKEAVLWYLARRHESRQTEQDRDSGCKGDDDVIQSKL